MAGRFDRNDKVNSGFAKNVATIIVQAKLYIPATVLSAFHVVNPHNNLMGSIPWLAPFYREGE